MQFKNKPKTVDGYAAYPTTEDTQRCWSHILIDSKNTIDTSEDKPAAQLLHEQLQEILHIAKGRSPGDVSDLSARILAIADKHEELGHKFATTLRDGEMDETSSNTSQIIISLQIATKHGRLVYNLDIRSHASQTRQERPRRLLGVFLKKTKKA